MHFFHSVSDFCLVGVPQSIIRVDKDKDKDKEVGQPVAGPLVLWPFGPLVIWRLVAKLRTKNEANGNGRGPAEKGVSCSGVEEG